MGSGLHHIRAADVELFAIREEAIRIVGGNLHDALVFAPRALEHFILAGVTVAGEMSDIGNVHHAFDFIAPIAEIAVENVFHNVGAQVSDVRKMIDRGAAGIHPDFARHDRDEFFSFMSGGIIK